MKKIFFPAMLCAALLAAGAFLLAAQQAPAPLPAGAKPEALRNLEDAANKAVRLAELIPQEKYTWRPTPEVRSFGEVFLHIVSGNLNSAQRLGGVAPPAGVQLGQGFETSTTDKARIIELLKASIENVRQAFNSIPDADVDKLVPNRPTTYRSAMFGLASHNHEHLGQLIAYTRMAGFVPPWTEEQQQRQRQAPPKKTP
jgi:uncharacterized damage-inducible protein DinB